MSKETVEPQVKASDEQAIHEGVKQLREAVESKNADHAETKEKVSKIETLVADIHAKHQKTFEEEAAKRKAADEEILTLKNQYDALYKQSNRIGFGANDNDADNVYRKKWSAELNGYFRKGREPNLDVMVECGNQYYEKDLPIIAMQEGGDLQYHKSLITGSGVDGGFLVFPERASFEIDRIFETSPMRAVARIATTTSTELNVTIRDQKFPSGGWTGEVQSRPVTNTPQIGELTIATHEHFAQPALSQKMLDDASFNVEQFIMDGIDDELVREENTAFVSGDGASKPRGFLSLPATTVPGEYQRGKLEQILSGVSGEVTADSLIDLQSSLKGNYQPRAVYLMTRATWGKVVKLKTGTGDYLIQMDLLKEGTGVRLLGKRVLFADDMQETAADSLSVVYGDFQLGYTIVDRLGLRILRDQLTQKPFILFYGTKRVGGDVTNYEAIKLLKLAA